MSLRDPVVDGVERVTGGDVVGDDDALGSLVVALSDGSEALLAGCIPDLKLADFLITLNRANLEINANRRLHRLCKVIISEPQQQATLSDT